MPFLSPLSHVFAFFSYFDYQLLLLQSLKSCVSESVLWLKSFLDAVNSFTIVLQMLSIWSFPPAKYDLNETSSICQRQLVSQSDKMAVF